MGEEGRRHASRAVTSWPRSRPRSRPWRWKRSPAARSSNRPWRPARRCPSARSSGISRTVSRSIPRAPGVRSSDPWRTAGIRSHHASTRAQRGPVGPLAGSAASLSRDRSQARALPDLNAAIALAMPVDDRCSDLAPRRAQLPLRYWRQQAHFTTPAEEAIARKAVEGGTSPMGRILDRFGVGPTGLADHLGVDVALVEQLLAEPRRAPLVMLDAEDALAFTDEAAELGRQGAADVLSTADWSGGGPREPALLSAAGAEPGDHRARAVRPAVGARGAVERRQHPARRHRVPQDRASRGGGPGPRHADRGGARPGPARRRHPGGLPGRVGLGRGAAAGDREHGPRTGYAPSSSASPTTPRTWVCRASATTTRSPTGHAPRSWMWPGPSGCPPSTA